jgi:hypothetical protein
MIMAADDESPSSAYRGQVAQIIGGAARASSFTPAKAVELYVKNRRAPKSVAELDPSEQAQFAKMWPGQDLDRLLQFGDETEDMPLDVEVADVVDAQGTHLYTMWGMNYGVLFLMAAGTLDCVAFASQHNVEKWGTDQRDLFWAMDRALRRGDHGFRQPLEFAWYEDARWAEIAGKPRGTLYSEASVRRQFGGG